MTEETKEQPKGLIDKFMDLYAPLAQQDASLSPEDYAQDYREKQNYVLKQLGLISPTSGVTTPENTRSAEDIIMRNGSQDQPTMDTVEQYVNNRVNYNPELGPVPVKDPNDPDEYRRNQMLEMMEINRMFDGLLQADDFALPTINVDQRSAYTSHLLSVVHGDREALAKKLVSKDLKALEGLDEVNAFYAGFDKNAVQAESTGSVALNSDFISALRSSESSGRTSEEYKDKKGDRFVGLDQVGSPRLKDFNKATGNNYTQNELKADATKQDEVASWHYNNHADNIKKEGLDRFIGQIDPKSGAEITLSGMLAVAHLGGFTGLQKYLTDETYNPKDELKTDLSKYMKDFSGLSVEGESSGPDLDSEGRPFLRPEVGAEVTQGSMLGSVFEAGKQALQAIGVDEETGKRVLDQLSEAGVLIKEEVSDLVSGKPSMPLPPRRPEFLGGLPEAQAKKIRTEESYKKLNIEEIANDPAANEAMNEAVAIASGAGTARRNPLGAIITEWFGVSENNKVGRDTLKAVFKSAIPSTDWENVDLTDFAWCTAALSAILYDTNNLADNQPSLASDDEPRYLQRNLRRVGLRIESDRNKALAYSTVGTALPLTKETPSFSSLSNEKIPEKIPDNTPVGSLVVFSWGMNEKGKEGQGHTALYTGRQQMKSSDRSKLIFGNNKKVPHILVAGGNQGNQLKLSWFPAADVRDLRKLKNIPDMTREEINLLNRLTKAEGAERNVTFPEGYDKILPPRRPESME